MCAAPPCPPQGERHTGSSQRPGRAKDTEHQCPQEVRRALAAMEKARRDAGDAGKPKARRKRVLAPKPGCLEGPWPLRRNNGRPSDPFPCDGRVPFPGLDGQFGVTVQPARRPPREEQYTSSSRWPGNPNSPSARYHRSATVTRSHPLMLRIWGVFLMTDDTSPTLPPRPRSGTAR